jgi:hypothetical protein
LKVYSLKFKNSKIERLLSKSPLYECACSGWFVALFLLLFSPSIQAQISQKNDIKNQSCSEKDSLKNQLRTECKSIVPIKPFDSNTLKCNGLFNAAIDKLHVKGITTLESYYSTFQNPRVISEPQYIRFSAYNSIDLFGLPFTSDVYYTTEINNIYNSNHFSLKFDKQKFSDQKTAIYKQKIESAKSKLNYKQYQTVLIEKGKNELEKEKGEIEGKQKDYELKLIQLAAEEQQRVTDMAKDSIKSPSSKLNSSPAFLTDSLNNQRDKQRNEIARLGLMADTHKLAQQYISISRKVDSAILLYQKYKNDYSEDSAKIADILNAQNNPNGLMSLWIGENQENGINKFISKVKVFNIGNYTAIVNPLSAYGLNARGVEAGFDLGKIDIGLNFGKTIPNDFSNYSRTTSSFDRNIGALSITTELNKRLTATLFGHYIYDPKEKRTKENKEAYRNSVYGLAVESQILRNVKLNGNIGKSNFDISNRTGLSGEVKVEPYIQSFQSSSAYDLEIQTKLSKSTDADAKYTYVGPNYRNLGNPFMRVNFIEYRAKVKQGIFKNQIKTSLFYKQLQNNPMRINEITNTTSGYGFSVQSRFKNKKLPNFNFQISPYEQGNNHPDSLFRVNNQFQLMVGGLTYFTQVKTIGVNIGVFGSNSVSQFSDTFFASVNTINCNIDLSFGRNFSLGGGYTSIRAKPYIDSSQVDVYQLRLNYKLGNKLSLGSDIFISDYANGSYRYGEKIQLSYTAYKGLNITLQGGYDKYHQLWGIENAEAWSGMLRLAKQF